MCGRFSLFAPPERVEERFDATFAYPYERRYNAAPGQRLPVVTDEHPAEIRAVRWGLVPTWADDEPDPELINARAETVGEKPSFRASFAGFDGGDDADERTADGEDEPGREAAGRCLVLADGFYEWGEAEWGKQPYRIARVDDEPFAMAGLWTRWRPPTAQTGLGEFAAGDPDGTPDLVETFAIVTTDANAAVAEIHDRMPVVLPPAAEREWLTAGPDEAGALLEPCPAELLRVYPVSRAVNDPSNDGRSVVQEIDTPG